MKRRIIHHPIHAAIEDVYATGHTPRLQIDARRADVEVPGSVRRTWQARLVIDLDPSYPLDLAYDPDGVSVDLAFQGMVSRCRLPWGAIYAVIDRSTGRGIVVEAHLPPAELAPELTWVDPASKRPRLAAVPPAGGASAPAVRAQGSPAKGSPAKSAPAPAPSESQLSVRPLERASTPSTAPAVSRSEPQPSPSVAPGAGSSSDEEAKERRARFRVIDGGR